MSRDELVRELLAERFPPVGEVDRERPPTPEEYQRRQRVLVESMEDHGWRRRVLLETTSGYGRRGRAPRSAA